MAKLIKVGSASKIVYDWWKKYELHKLDLQEMYKLCVIEVNEMYRDGESESPLTDGEYDYILSMIKDKEFKLSVGTGLGEQFIPKYLINIIKE